MICIARRLPVELLAQIVQFAAIDEPKTAFHVSQVCSEWRSVVHIPALWSFIEVVIREDKPYPLEQTRLWIARAEDLALRITLRVDQVTQDLQPIAVLLGGLAYRLHSLSVTAPLRSMVVHALSLFPTDFPTLCTLSIATWYDGDDQTSPEDVHLSTLLGALPSLQALSFDHTSVPFCGLPQHLTTLNMKLRLNNLTEAEAGPVLPSVLACLREVPLLRQLSIDASPFSLQRRIPWEVGQPVIVDLPKLQHLSITAQFELFSILDHIHAPALRGLHLRSSPVAVQDDIDAGVLVREWIHRLLRKAETSPLEVLTLYDVNPDPEPFFPELFALTPQLRELRLHDVDIKDGHLLLLTHPHPSANGQPSLCSRLEKIDLRWCGSVSGRALVNLVKSRQDPAQFIQTRSASDALGSGKQLDVDGDITSWSSIREVAAINCILVKDDDVAELASLTLCRVRMLSTNDFCGPSGRTCCRNEKYRSRLRLHLQGKNAVMPHLCSSRGLLV